MNDRCDRAWEIDALREGRLSAKDADAFERHARTCADCIETRARDTRLRELAREMPKTEPSDLDLRRLRARVLRDAELENPGPFASRGRVALALVAAACVMTATTLVVRSHHRGEAASTPITNAPSAASAVTTSAPTTPEAFAGTVAPNASARWKQTREDGTERVQLDDGALDLHVRHQTPGEHFFVDVPDGRIEVRGTTFHVEVGDGVTTRVDVSEGVVSVRLAGSPEVVLHAGRSWVRPEAVAAAQHKPVTPSSSSPITGNPAADRRSSDEYAAAVALLQSGSYDAAAKSFADFLSAHANASQAEDASYLEAASLARGGRPDAAALVAEQHLAAYPHSFHRKEAAILVARAARDRGDCAKAREALAPWLGTTPDADAVATLRSCALP